MVQTPMPSVRSARPVLNTPRAKAWFLSMARGLSFHVQKGVGFQTMPGISPVGGNAQPYSPDVNPVVLPGVCVGALLRQTSA